MSIRISLAAGALATVALIAGCGSDSGTMSSTPTTAKTSPPASASGTKVAVRQTGLGKTLVDGAGRTLYLFEKDSGGQSACYGACAQVWSPFTTSSRPAAGPGAEASKVGTAKRRDGANQVTYAGHPLYRYAPDRKPGDTRGQELDQFGAEWYALSPAGGNLQGKGSQGQSSGGGGGASGGGGGGGYSY